MTERDDIQHERDMANGLFAWFQLDDDVLHPPLNTEARRRIGGLFPDDIDLNLVRGLVREMYKEPELSVMLTLAGFEESVIRSLDAEGTFNDRFADFMERAGQLWPKPVAEDVIQPQVTTIERAKPTKAHAVVPRNVARKGLERSVATPKRIDNLFSKVGLVVDHGSVAAIDNVEKLCELYLIALKKARIDTEKVSIETIRVRILLDTLGGQSYVAAAEHHGVTNNNIMNAITSIGASLTTLVTGFEEEITDYLENDKAVVDDQAELAELVSSNLGRPRRRVQSGREDTGDRPAASSSLPDNYKSYLVEIGRTPLLKPEQEPELAMAVEAGLFAAEVLAGERTRPSAATNEELEELVTIGAEANDHFLRANLRLVVSIARRYQGRGMSLEDLTQEGNLGLMRAVEKFNYKKGYKFSTYATWWIRQAVTRALADQARTIRIPVHMVEQINTLVRTRRHLESTQTSAATPEQIAKEMDLSPDKVREIMKYMKIPVSLSTPIGDDDGAELQDLIEDGSLEELAVTAERGEVNDKLQYILETLSERERFVVTERMGLRDGVPKTLDDIGKQIGVTRERVRQIESKTMSKLRHPSRAYHLRGLL